MAKYKEVLDELSRLRKLEVQYEKYRTTVVNIVSRQIEMVRLDAEVMKHHDSERVISNLQEVLRKISAVPMLTV